ncbi:Evolved beta-galactosidase subunit alpha [Nymphon striatum]|nr:Evolved beta-galactosidase subunit alpha [Nymphon striatum]
MSGVWQSRVAEQYHPFVVPQEHGAHSDTLWLTLADRHGKGLRIVCDQPSSFSARFEHDAMLAQASTIAQVDQADTIEVHVDAAVRGLGTAACGPDCLPEYIVRPGTWRLGAMTNQLELGGHDGERSRFHLAIPVAELGSAEEFYGELLGCAQGRRSEQWIDWNLGGHQLVTHVIPGWTGVAGTNPVDGNDVPVPHFGVLMTPESFHALAERLTAAQATFVIEPTVRFAGEVGEQHTMFLLDPSGNALEFKAFADDSQVFAT